MWGWWLYIKLNGMRCHLNGAPRYFDDNRHQPRRLFIIRQPSRQTGEGFKEEKGRRQHACVLINDNHHSPLNASDRP